MARGTGGKGLYRNPLSYFGGLVVAGSALLIAFSLTLSLVMKQGSPYIGILTYLLFPMFLVLGILIFFVGIRREIRRRRRAGAEAVLPYPTLDLNEPIQRKKFTYAVLAGFALLLLLAVVSYHAFIFTESVTFCGRVCHTVMEPEFTAYLASPHARVRCVDCHVGSGASWYVKSKLSGARQVLAVTFHSYPTPIGVPVRNLRPARETCEECHWPQKFYGAQLIQNAHFRYDENNSPEQVSLLVKTGGGSPKLGTNAGIHWHMIIQNKIEYVALDEMLQQIPWVTAVGPDGTRREYVNKDAVPPPEKLAAMTRHTMDCMDCHNRPTHIFQAPEGAIDRALASGLIPPTLPWIKKVSVDALVKDYPSRDAAHQGIRADIMAFYEKRYPAVRTGRSGDLEDTIRRVTDIYDRSVFPEMKVNWTTYASNIGHRNWPGCFRCHDGKHVSGDGQVLSKECTTCHTMPQRGGLSPIGTAMPTSDRNWHPWELKGKHAEILCNRCHAAGYRPPTACADCHKLDAKAPMMDGGCDSCHAAEQQVKPLNDCTACHEKLPELHAKGGHPDAACTDCHKPHTWKVTGREICIACHDDKKAHYPDRGDCSGCHQFKAPAAKSARSESAPAASHGA